MSLVHPITAISVLGLLIVTAPEVSAIKAHPCLITTQAGVELARLRVKEENWAKEALARLKRQADQLASEPLPVFEKDWWEEASKKNWSEIYPEVNHHTNFAVSGAVSSALSAAMAYAAAGDPAHADLVKKVLLHYADYEFFAEHPDVGLNWSIWVSRALMAYDLVYDTIEDSDRRRIDRFFERAVQAVMKNDVWWLRHNPGGLFNNHFAWHKFLIGSYGLFYDREDLVDYALNSDQGIRALIEHGSRDDGLWLESSINYHFTAVQGLVEFARQLANSEHSFDLWNAELANGRRLKALFTGPLQPLFPDLTLPTIGDTYGARLRLDSVNAYYLAYDAYRLPEIAWLLRNRVEMPADALFLPNLPGDVVDESPRLFTRLWPEHGYVALRTQEGRNYWEGEGFSAFLSYDSDGIHSHRDKFGLMLFARGSHIAVDPDARSTARHAFSAQIQAELNRSTVCHNTVMVDGLDHRPIPDRLELVDFVNTDSVKMASIADRQGRVYEGVRMMRTFAVTPDYALDVFQVSSDTEHTYDYLFHSLADSGRFDADGEFTPTDLGENGPWKWLRNAGAASFDSDWSASTAQGSLTARLMMLGEPGTRVITCDFPAKDDFSGTPIPMLIARRTARSTVFVALIQAERGPLPRAAVELRDSGHGFLRVLVECNGVSREFSVRRL